MVDVVELDPERPADDEAHVATGLPASLEEAAERARVELLAAAIQERDERAGGEASRDPLLLAHLDHLDARVPSEELEVVLDVIGVGRAQTPHCEDDEAHTAILSRDG